MLALLELEERFAGRFVIASPSFSGGVPPAERTMSYSGRYFAMNRAISGHWGASSRHVRFATPNWMRGREGSGRAGAVASGAAIMSVYRGARSCRTS